MGEDEMAARAVRIDVEGFGVNRVDDFAGVFQSIATGRFNALDVLAGPIVTGNRARILAFSSQARIPDLYQERPFVEAGGLLSYGPNFERLFHRMAYGHLEQYQLSAISALAERAVAALVRR